MIDLNLQQRQAVEHGTGPLLVIAGPGSGKTRVITERIVHLLARGDGVAAENILALTFTEKAAGEMKRRVGAALPGLPSSPHISTFHSFCYQLLRERHFERILLDKVDVWIFLRRRMLELGLEFYQKLAEPGAFLHALNEFFSRCQDELIEPDDFEAFVKRGASDFAALASTLDPAERMMREGEIQKLQELARVFRRSRELIEEAGCSSLGSLISETVRLWDREPELLERTRARFRFVLVDEFQDTNYGQVELLRRLVAPPFNITAVGDDDQAIYRFRGASHGAFEMFDKVLPGHDTVYLGLNYRSTKRILRAADGVIAKNTRYEKKKALDTMNPEGERVFLLESPDYASEAAWVAEEVERLAARGMRLADIAVLYRAHNYRDLLVNEFRRRRIPFAIRGLSVLSTAILRDLVAYLNLVHSPHHNISLTRVLLAPRWRFSEELAIEARRQASKARCSLWDALGAMERALFKHEIESTGWGELRDFVGGLAKAAHRLPMTSLFDELMEKLDLRFLPSQPEAAYVTAFRKFLETWETKSETRRLREFMEYFQYFLDAGGKIEIPEPAEPPKAVQMMTVHAAKGLEFPVVFILSVAPRRFPHSEQKPVIQFPDELRKGPQPPPDIHVQEERRLFYVAMTRAERKLYVSSVVKPGKKPSAFIDDLVSIAAVAARDIEKIQVPAVSGDEAAPAATARLALSEPRLRGEAQPGLFNEAGASWAPPDLVKWTDSPPEIPADGKLLLSATAIESYRDCPLKFKFSHYLKIPTGPQPALTFGNIMHQAVRYFVEQRKKTKSPPAYEAVAQFFLSVWKDAGFEDAYQEQAYKKAGLEQLRAFVEGQKEARVPPERIRTEEFFRLDLGEVVLEGRIDQIQPLAAGDGQTVELIDYKTGRPRSQKDADKSLQLSIYALAARDQLKMTPARLTFYNLTSNQPVSTVRTAKDLDAARKEIQEVAEEIRRMVFHPTPGFTCRFCDFVPVCPAHEEIH
jgi:DNA helicase-2/ATP-dependent DNA helicase PcrA